MKFTHFIQQNAVSIRFTVFLSSFIVMGYVLADGHHYTYPSDTIKIQKKPYYIPAYNKPAYKNYSDFNHSVDKSADKVQSAYPDTSNAGQIQYRYPPLTRKLGSNPFNKDENRYASTSYPGDYKESSTHTLSSTGYTYPPATQKPGSNPFYKVHNQYAGSYPTKSTVSDSVAVVSDTVSDSDTMTYGQAGVIYIYPPLTQQLGSNPFNKSSHQYADSKRVTTKKQISSSDQEQYRYLYFYQAKPRYIESSNGFMSYTDTHLMYP